MSMSDQDNSKLQDLVDLSVFYRGSIITEWIHLEKYIESYILNYFTKDTEKQLELAQLLINRLNFESKRSVFKTILEKKAIINGFKKTKSNSYPDSELLDEIRKINLERNYFAHYVIDYSEDAVILSPNQITLMEFRDKTVQKAYTQKDYLKLRSRILDVAIKVDEMVNDLNSE